MSFDGSCVGESGCWELFDCPATVVRGTCPIGRTTFSANRCSTSKLVGFCTFSSNRQNCGIKGFHYDLFNDLVKSLDAAESSCIASSDGEWSTP
jgi:hypothetical protein